MSRRRLPLWAALVLSAACQALGCRQPEPPEPTRTEPVARVSGEPGVVLRRGCTPTGPERCFDAVDDNCNGIIDEGCGVRTGLLQFAIAWDKAAADVDLEVTDPNGEVAELERVSESGLTKERDCPGRNAECHGQNLENVYLEGTDSPRGRYRVRVRLDKLGGEEPPVAVKIGARVGPRTYRAELQLDAAGEHKELIFDL